MSSVITTEHFPVSSSYPTLNSKRRRHRYSTNTTSQGNGSEGERDDFGEEGRSKKGVTVEYYDIHGRLLRLYSNQGDLFLPERGHSRCEDPSSSRTTPPAPARPLISDTTPSTRVGRRDTGYQDTRDGGASASEVGEFGRLRSRSVTRERARSGGRGQGRVSRDAPEPDWLQAPPRPSPISVRIPSNQVQSLPSASSRRPSRPTSTPPSITRLQAPATLVHPSTKSLSQGSPLARNAVESRVASGSNPSQPPSAVHRVVLNPPAPPPVHSTVNVTPRPTSTSNSTPSTSRLDQPSGSSSSAATATEPQQTIRSLRRKPGFVRDRPKTHVLDAVSDSHLLHPDNAAGLGHRRHLSSPPALLPTAPRSDPSSSTTDTTHSAETSLFTPPGSILPPHRRNLSEGNVSSMFGAFRMAGEGVDVDEQGARWYHGTTMPRKGKEKAEEDLRLALQSSDDDDEGSLRRLSSGIQSSSPSFWPPEWPTPNPPPSSFGNYIDSQNLRTRRKSDFGVVGFASQNDHFDALSEGAEIDYDRDHLDGVPPLVSAFGLGKGYPSYPLVRERKPTMGRWGRRVVVSDPGLLPAPVVVMDCESTENEGQ